MHPYVELATAAIRAYATTGKKIPSPEPLPEDMKRPAGVFVSLKKHGELRGCIGTIFPATHSLAAEIIANAVASSSFDPRFPPVDSSELGELSVSVDVLSEPSPVSDVSTLDARKFGVIISTKTKRGLLLPDIEGVDTAAEQIAICRRKGGIGPFEKAEIERFTVARYK
ncbi:MAG: AmmeMemoRadiSam system protein A [Nitrospinae bacterium]|nr:AmmeMemoRadiSam system protein A [Nitrospinota bacterium]